MLWGGATGEWEGEHPAHASSSSPWAAEIYPAGWRGHRHLVPALASADLLAVPSVAQRFTWPVIASGVATLYDEVAGA